MTRFENEQRSVLRGLLRSLNDENVATLGLIPWASPVPTFGDLGCSKVATLGLNPSNREFVSLDGCELTGEAQRLPTLRSLGLDCWASASRKHHDLILEACWSYFKRSPYDGWFGQLDFLLQRMNASYYGSRSTIACHLDLIPFATIEKWTALTTDSRRLLLEIGADALGRLLKASPVKTLVVNGRSVIDQLFKITDFSAAMDEMPMWALRRKGEPTVKGYSFSGVLRVVHGISLEREVRVLGFNHNLQSSFGVTSHVRSEIANWIEKSHI
ncbi:MAG: hypothetical protein JNM99_10565 [Verrucomicrobiaceae bacterium]|nr:hypothetical protein [Verrucomicrobiaceae bacterium]